MRSNAFPWSLEQFSKNVFCRLKGIVSPLFMFFKLALQQSTPITNMRAYVHVFSFLFSQRACLCVCVCVCVCVCAHTHTGDSWHLIFSDFDGWQFHFWSRRTYRTSKNNSWWILNKSLLLTVTRVNHISRILKPFLSSRLSGSCYIWRLMLPYSRAPLYQGSSLTFHPTWVPHLSRCHSSWLHGQNYEPDSIYFPFPVNSIPACPKTTSLLTLSLHYDG